MFIVGSVPELDGEPFFSNCISPGVANNREEEFSEFEDDGEWLIPDADDCTNNGDNCVANNGDKDLSEPEDCVECLILDADNCAGGLANNGDRDLSEPEDDGECLFLGADDCACCVAENGDLSESEDDGVYAVLDADDCTCCVAKNGDEELSESEDDGVCRNAADKGCDWVHFGNGVSVKIWHSSLLCNVKYEIHVAIFVVCSDS